MVTRLSQIKIVPQVEEMLAAVEGLSAEDRAALGLDERASVLLINTEGATAPAVYAALVGDSAEAVAARRDQWQPAD